MKNKHLYTSFYNIKNYKNLYIKNTLLENNVFTTTMLIDIAYAPFNQVIIVGSCTKSILTTYATCNTNS